MLVDIQLTVLTVRKSTVSVYPADFSAFYTENRYIFCINRMGSFKFNILTMTQPQIILTINGGTQNLALFE